VGSPLQRTALNLARQARRCVVLALVLYLILLLDWQNAAHPSEPRLLRAFHASSGLKAGAMKVRLSPPLPLVRPGFRYPRIVADREQDPLEVRAVVLRAGGRRLALVLADLMVVSEELDRGLESRLADLHLDAIIFVATHSHSSVGGFDSHLVAQVLGLGRYRPDVVKGLLDRAEEAVRGAENRLTRVHVHTAETHIPGWAVNRSRPGAEVDDALTVAVLERDDGERVATLVVVAAHPTLFPRGEPQLSPDYPGIVMRRLEGLGGVALLLQGAVGDAAAPGDGWLAMQSAGAFVAQHAVETLEPAALAEDRLGVAEVEIRLPPIDVLTIRPFLLRRPASNLLEWMLPNSARVGLIRLGDLTLLTVPGEPTELAAREIVANLPTRGLGGRAARVVALAQGYVSYIDTPERVEAVSGEARRAWYGPTLLPVVEQGLQLAVASQQVQRDESESMSHAPRLDALWGSMFALGILLVCAGAGMAALQLRKEGTMRPASRSVEAIGASRRVFLAGWLVLVTAFIAGVAICGYYLPD
jgi:neutral ceramidase